ncbi:hypothetical protein FF38_09493 [Lucilia cuprina]|uniref:Uncharacterized protein n=1 Tax=Lucilia cuprina TaxID=7375 RepID=A0A0L0BRA8_LUCCU|nr:hypothetical protein CVS40_4691 [Lucilia cuprina]KNC22551.1 hypothetical protein FF38_09493 [Lucilia cuprina]
MNLLLIVYNLTTVQGNCEVYISRNSQFIPKFERQIGNIKLQVNITNDKFEIGIGESVTGSCETYFGSLENTVMEVYDLIRFSKIQSIELSCKEDILFYQSMQVYRPHFECLQTNWDIVYNKDNISRCRNLKSISLLLLSKINNGDISFAKLCYDLEKVSLRNIHYTVQNTLKTNSEMLNDMEFIYPSLNPYNLSADLHLLKTTKSVIINNNLLQQQFINLYELNPLLSFANYEVSSIVQGHSYAEYFKEYNVFLNIIWWRNLRLGNWKMFINTLENYAINNRFEILTGTSGIVELPINLTEKHSKKLELEIDMKTITVPEYIWSYVSSSDIYKQDFIIVAYNSPYAEFFSLDNIIFCPDICADIPWLKNVYTSFRYSFAGIMFCCSLDFIRKNNPLEGFPIDVLNVGSVEN